MDWMYELEKLVIVIVGLLMTYAEWSQAIKYRRSWVKWGLGVMGIYWSIYYTYSLIRTVFDMPFPEHRVFVRIGILLTISFVASGAFLTLRELKRLHR